MFAFYAAYAIGMLAVGRFIDRVGTRVGYAIVMVFWSLASMAHAAGSGLFSFMMARVALGFGEAGVFPASIKVVAEWFLAKERALAAGIFNVGTNVGVIAAALFVPWITLQLGWRWAFIIVGSLGFVWLGLWLLLYRKPAEHPRCSKVELQYILGDTPPAVQKIKVGCVSDRTRGRVPSGVSANLYTLTSDMFLYKRWARSWESVAWPAPSAGC